MTLTAAERRSVRRRRVGRMDDGMPAFPVRKGDTEDIARAVIERYDADYTLGGKQLVEWCRHNADYAYRHGCGDWCDNPSSTVVWVAAPAATEAERD